MRRYVPRRERRPGRDRGPQRRLVGAQLRARGCAPRPERIFDANLQAGQPGSYVAADGGSLPLRSSWLIRRRRSIAARGVLTAA